MRANIKLALSKLLPVALLALLNNVIAKLFGNALFATPPFTEAEMQAQSDKLKDAIEQATAGSIAAKRNRDKVVLETQSMLRVTADFVRQKCNGDAALLATSGFELARLPLPIGSVGVPPRVVAVPTSFAGEVEVRWGKVPGARMFDLEQADRDPSTGEAVWTRVALCTRQRYTVQDLTPYAPVWFRVSAIGTAGQGLPSDVVMGRAA